MAPIERLDIAVNGVHYRVSRSGTGPALMLLHGFTGSAASWAPWVEELGASFQVVTPDLLGHGDSDAPLDPARYEAAAQVDDLAAL
ncbi:MAG: alpha/beta fold hydrolase, partial [Thermomicrobiales bacterium]